ncbi:hypothetical protein DID96_11555 [Burkholderia sp. Bp8963]|nr:hypothetical protein DID96_11555 [Burkholderia sp. Bp8963]
MGALAIVIPITAASLGTFIFQDALAQNSAATAKTGKANPTTTFKVPPLPNGSAHVSIKPGMSDKDWANAYKETGRPKFDRKTVKRAGGNVQRD